MKSTTLFLAAFLVGLFTVSTLFADEEKIERKIYTTKHVNPKPPEIDGVMDEPVWESVAWATGFTQRQPNEGEPATQKTAFKILYDDKNLYVGVHAYDTHPDSIVKRMSRRDGFEGDWIEINIDSYLDHRTAYSFNVNVSGVKGDEAVSNDGDNWDANWDPVWYVDTSVDDQGWVAEMQIPFSQLRFSHKDEHVWGFQISRKLYREDEISVWQFIPRDSRGWVNRFGEIHGLSHISMPRRIELLPFTMGQTEKFKGEAGNPFATGHDSKLDFGLDGKIGVTSHLNLDFTFNPDFGQVEADPSVVNLTAYETRFDEKRPFFIEGSNILDYKFMIGNGDFGYDNLFYSRRIGAYPHHEPDTGDDEYLDMPESASILGALKLTGKTQNGYSIGVLEAVTSKENAEIDNLGKRRKEAVEPMTNYFIGRMLKDYNEGASHIGMMVTNTYRDLHDASLNFLNKNATTGGIDWTHQWKNRTYTFVFNNVFSHVQGSREAILETQEASPRYYQRPDADHLKLDPKRTSLTGFGGTSYFAKFGGEHFQYIAGATWRSPGLELNDMGYLRQADVIMEFIWWQYRIQKPFSIFRYFYLGFNQWKGWNFGGEDTFSGGNIYMDLQFKNQWYAGGTVSVNGRDLNVSALRGGPSLYLPSRWGFYSYLQTDNRKALRLSGDNYHSISNDKISFQHNYSIDLTWRPINALSISAGPFYNINKDNLQYIDTFEKDEENRYVFGRIDQKTVGMTLRFTYCITPNLTIQYYGQPFVSAGKYTHLKRITDPRASEYKDRFHEFVGNEISYDPDWEGYDIDEDIDGATDYSFDKPDFNFRQFRSNLVVRWEYTPGSTLYFVWSQNRTGDDNIGDFSFRNDMNQLFEVYPHDVFLIKINRWFSL